VAAIVARTICRQLPVVTTAIGDALLARPQKAGIRFEVLDAG
jgi:hypothetical protein